MRILYDIFFTLFSIGYLPCLFFKGKFHAELSQRFGFLREDVLRVESPVWIHAVSVGEVNLAVRLSASLKEAMPGLRVVISTTTRTGNELARKSVNKGVDAVFYYPLDISGIVRKVAELINPRAYVIVETEIWPNMIEEMRRRGTPVILVNGRISDSSFGNYKKIGVIIKRILSSISCFCMQSAESASRIKALGAPEERVYVTGNIKFDIDPVTSLGQALGKNDLGFSEGDDVIIAGSTHFPEETAVLGIFNRMKEKKPGLRLILAPRHVERSEAIKVYCERSGITHVCLSDILKNGKSLGGIPPQVVLVDTIGHLRELYMLATIVFIGGSIAKKGGQNPIEAAMWGKPVVFGPNMHNFRQVSSFFLEKDAAVQVKSAEELERVLEEMLKDRAWRERLSMNAKNVISDNAGASARTAARIKAAIEGLRR